VLEVENYLPWPYFKEDLIIKSVANKFSQVDGKLIVTQPQETPSWNLRLVFADGRERTEVLETFEQMDLARRGGLAKVLEEKISKMINCSMPGA